MRSIERSARTVEEAIAEALQELQVAREDVEVEILDEGSRAFLGLIGGKPARVRVTVRDKREEKAQAVAAFLQGILDRMGIGPKWSILGRTTMYLGWIFRVKNWV